MNNEQGCYRCGRSVVLFLGIAYTCPGCDKRFCDACINAYGEEQRTACPVCDLPVASFIRNQRDAAEEQ